VAEPGGGTPEPAGGTAYRKKQRPARQNITFVYFGK